MILSDDMRAWLRSDWRTQSKPLWGVGGFLVVCSVLFWYLRFTYWHETHEAPFSDMWGYVVTGDNIYNHFFFGVDDGRPTYLTPVTPSIIAIAKLMANHFDRPYRVLVQIITFASALALVREIALLTGRKWLAASFLLIVAICRPSIFWSLKFATEPVCEAFLYATAASALATLRTRGWGWALACGFFALCLGLNRPNFLAGTMLIPLAFLLYECIGRARIKADREEQETENRLTFRLVSPRAFLIAGLFALTFFGTWSVWVGRNLINYGAFILTSSSGAQSAIWDFGGAPVKVGRYSVLTLADGTTFSDFGHFSEEAYRYPKDYMGAQRLFLIARAWLWANWMDLPHAFFLRLKNLVAFSGANGLTKVPRDHLFIGADPAYNNPYAAISWLDVFLLDKTPIACLLGLLGVLVFAWLYPAAGVVMIGLAIAPWIMAAMVIGYERIVESLTAITIWFALLGVFEIVPRLSGPPSRT